MTESGIGRQLPIVADRPALEVASRVIVRPPPRDAGIGATGILLDW
ncbi:MAG: hypothetical protein ABIQ79_08910 [Nitrospiraceae bacterium]|jgi:hypothetical protein